MIHVTRNRSAPRLLQVPVRSPQGAAGYRAGRKKLFLSWSRPIAKSGWGAVSSFELLLNILIRKVPHHNLLRNFNECPDPSGIESDLLIITN